MSKIKLILIALAFSLNCVFGQQPVLSTATYMPKPSHFTIDELNNYLRDHINCLKPNEDYNFQFIVEADGTLSDFKQINETLEKICQLKVKMMMDKWIPAKDKNNEVVRVLFNLSLKGANKNSVSESGENFIEKYSNDIVHVKGSLFNNLKQGSWTWYSDNGQVNFKISFIDGIKNGDYTIYSKDGSIAVKGNYYNGKNTTSHTENEKGLFNRMEIEVSRFDENHYSNGQVRNKETSEEQITYFENGQISSNLNLKTGDKKEYYQSGKLKRKGKIGFVGGGFRETGEWVEYDEKGTVIKKKVY